MSFFKFVKCSANIFLRFFFHPSVFLLFFWDSNDTDIGYFVTVLQICKALLIFFLSMFSLCCSDWANSIDLSSSLLIISSVKSYLLLSPYSTLFFLLFCLFYNSCLLLSYNSYFLAHIFSFHLFQYNL